MASEDWKVSLHGGHSGEFCEHATSTLREVLEAAVAFGYRTFGVSEHAPRSQERFLYPAERAKGYTIERLNREFEAYAGAVDTLASEFKGRLIVLRGFETEVVPSDGYRDEMLAWRKRFEFDYMVGSVHYVDEISVDGERADFDAGVAQAGGLEPYAVRYYETVAAMVEALRPDVVGHLDLIRKNADPGAALDTPPIREAAQRALAVIKQHDCILDLNTAGYRKGLGSPYPAPWLVRLADEMRIGFCFGDDSHGPAQVGEGLDQAREYLLNNGVSEIRVLTREAGAVVKKSVRLKSDSAGNPEVR
ncbi:MAG TPA: histidinol-phosphatase [Bryobacterales bacterium]|nr:histidinol-phosphatase [Bryobacterales bacterium]